MTITATIIADSISDAGQRLTTMQLRYPRFIHAEFMTHRVFSRNASSSRAIPVARMIEDLRRDPAMPIYWGSNKPGMQAGEELSAHDIERVKSFWLVGMENAIRIAEEMMERGLHKQIANRLLEPWSHINVVVTSSQWENWDALRRHTDAQPEIHQLANVMHQARLLSLPQLVKQGEWHLPYVDFADEYLEAQRYCQKGRITRDMPGLDEIYNVLRKVSTARCARVSYLTHDGRKTTIEEDVELHDRLVVAEPLHASPAEHQATPDRWLEGEKHGYWEHDELHGNLTGWQQYRKMLPGEFTPG